MSSLHSPPSDPMRGGRIFRHLVLLEPVYRGWRADSGFDVPSGREIKLFPVFPRRSEAGSSRGTVSPDTIWTLQAALYIIVDVHSPRRGRARRLRCCPREGRTGALHVVQVLLRQEGNKTWWTQPERRSWRST